MVGNAAPSIALHANAFLVARTSQEVKLRAKRELPRGAQSLHSDDLYEVDECLEVALVDGHHIHLEPTNELRVFEPSNGYHVIPKDVIARYAASRQLSWEKTPSDPLTGELP